MNDDRIGLVLAALDEVERRHRREFDAMRAWVVRLRRGQESSFAPLGPDAAHTAPMPQAMTIARAAAELMTSESTIKRLIRDGALRSIKVLGSTRVLDTDLRAFLESAANRAADGRLEHR